MQNNSTQKVLHKKVNTIYPGDIHGAHCDFILQTSSNAQGKQRHSGGFKNSVKKSDRKPTSYVNQLLLGSLMVEVTVVAGNHFIEFALYKTWWT